MSKAAQNTLKRAVVAAVQLPKVSDLEFEASLNELRELAKTLGFEVVATFTQKRTSFDSTAYLGLGKREELRRYVQGEAEAEENPLAEDSATVSVAEWTADCWNGNFHDAPSDGRPWMSGDCFLRAVRGGAWDEGPASLRSAYRVGSPVVIRVYSRGFRVARQD
jgi:hypothetical protein